MRILTDIIGLSGYVMLVAGIYLKYGLAIALGMSGGGLLLFAILLARGYRRA